MKHIYMLLLCLVAMSAQAQRLSHDFQGESLSEALVWIDKAQEEYKLNFIYDELEDFTVTTQLKNASVRDAVRQVCGFYPMHLTFDHQDIYIECVQKSDTKLSGRIINESGQPVAYASISLLSLGDSTFLTGGVSNEAGDFVIPCKASSVIARITCIGYKKIEKTFKVGKVGTILMQTDKYTIKGVEVKGMQRMTTATDRGLLTTIQGTPLEQFGSVSEMLRHLPLVMADGSVAGHGKPEIYINNKKVRNSEELDRLRADEILSAEVITNPGVEYGAEVTSVIRLKTARRQGEGWSGNFSAAYRQGKEYYANGNAALNYRLRNGMDFFARGYLTDNNTLINATANDQLQASSTWDYQKHTNWRNRSKYYFADLGWNWELSESHSLGLTYTANSFIGDAEMRITSDEVVQRDGVTADEDSNLTLTKLHPGLSHAVNAYYVGELGKWQLDFSADYYGGHSESDMEGGTVGEEGVSSQTLTKNNLLAEKLVVTAPIPKGTLTFGEEVSGVDRKSDFTQSGFSADNSVHQKSVTWSLFANYALQVKKFSLNAGLRWQNEHNDYETNGRKDSEQSPDYHVLIPRLSLTYRTERWTHTFSYQCFRQNPTYSTLSTAVNYRSKYEYQTGNPYLRPMTTHYVSWTTNYRWAHAELYYQYIKNLNHSFQVAYDDTNYPGVILDDRRNVPKSQNYGLEINVTPKIGIWQMNYSADFFFNNRDLEAIGITHQWNGLGTYFNLDNTLSLPNNWLLNIGMELTPNNEQGCSQTKTTGGMNLRLSHQFLKDKSLSIAVLANDILHTRYIEMTAYGGINVRTQFREYRDSRRIGIDLSWKFNATKSRYKGSHAGQSERNRL